MTHHSQFLKELADSGKLKIEGQKDQGTVTYHDPCYLSRANGVVAEPRDILKMSLAGGDGALVEMKRNGCATGCCGGGGGRMWFDDRPQERVGRDRVEEVESTHAKTVAVSCPFCMTMMRDGLAAKESSIEVKDVAELLLEATEA